MWWIAYLYLFVVQVDGCIGGYIYSTTLPWAGCLALGEFLSGIK